MSANISRTAGAGCPAREFQAQSGNTVWGQVRKSMEDAGLLNGLDPASRDAAIQKMVNEVRVLDASGKEIPNKNLIYAGAKYRLEFPGSAESSGATAASNPTQQDQFQESTPALVPGLSGVTPNNGSKSRSVAEEIANEAATWSYASELEQRGRSMEEAVANEGGFAATERGVCTDMAFRAANLFQERGIDARVIGGLVRSTGGVAGAQTTFAPGQVQHAWVEFKGEDGQWHRFDPTVAAQKKSAQAAMAADGNPDYLLEAEILDDSNMNDEWKNTIQVQLRSQALVG
jgi:Transglutaminase-like superfamily